MIIDDLSLNELSSALVEQLEQPGRVGETIEDTTLQRLLGHTIRAYSQRVNSSEGNGDAFFSPYPEDLRITPTEAATTAAALLRAAEVTTFEIAAMFNL